jgi:putative nucleotidyltransferase with HDIG domain
MVSVQLEGRSVIAEVKSSLFRNIYSAWSRDEYTVQHSRQVARLCGCLGVELGVEDTESLEMAGLLHDVGKLTIPHAILLKVDPLTTNERALLQGHPHVGAWLATMAGAKTRVVEAIRQHHERLDGSGYPQGLSIPEISWLGRIVAVADVYGAMTEDRPYRPALVHHEALKYLDNRALFDPEVVAALRVQIARRQQRRPAEATPPLGAPAYGRA